MASLNSVTLVGHMGQDAKINYTQSGMAVANLSVATSMRVKGADGQYTDKTEWHKVTAWDKTADFCGKYLHKGSMVLVEGRIETRKWQDKDGQDRYSTEIVANRVQCLDKREAGQGDGQSQPPVQMPKPPLADDAELGPAFPRDASGMDDVPF